MDSTPLGIALFSGARVAQTAGPKEQFAGAPYPAEVASPAESSELFSAVRITTELLAFQVVDDFEKSLASKGFDALGGRPNAVYRRVASTRVKLFEECVLGGISN